MLSRDGSPPKSEGSASLSDKEEEVKGETSVEKIKAQTLRNQGRPTTS